MSAGITSVHHSAVGVGKVRSVKKFSPPVKNFQISAII
jgi:hypothetical protein